MSNDNEPAPYLTATMLENGKIKIAMQNISLLSVMATSMILLDKVYDKLMNDGNLETAELVGSVLQALAALVQLAEDNSKSN